MSRQVHEEARKTLYDDNIFVFMSSATLNLESGAASVGLDVIVSGPLAEHFTDHAISMSVNGLLINEDTVNEPRAYTNPSEQSVMSSCVIACEDLHRFCTGLLYLGRVGFCP